MDNNSLHENSYPERDVTIFSGEEFNAPLNYRSIRNARNAMFFAAGAIVLNMIIIYSGNSDTELIWFDLLVWGLFVASFILLGIWTKSKPYTALVIAITLYGLFILLNAALDVSTIFKGIIMKVIIIVYLIKAINDAKEVQEYDKLFNENLLKNRS